MVQFLVLKWDKLKLNQMVQFLDLNWVKLAEGMGVAASKSTTVKAFREQFESAMKTRGPCLIEVEL